MASFDDSDAFGHVVYDRWKGREVRYVIERDDGYLDVDDLHTYFADYQDWPPRLKRAIRLVAGQVLDVGCGAGRAALYLQRQGHAVLGIDTSPLAIKVCRLRGLKHAKLMSVTQVSKKQGVFDTILMLGNNFGLLGNVRRTQWLLRRFYGITSDRAIIIAETVDPARTQVPQHRDYQRRNRSRGRMPGQVRLRIRYQRYASAWFDYLFVSPMEMTTLLRGTGWRARRFIKSQGPSYIAVLDKGR
jgi:SAM-dependent methyltransferase